MTIAIAVRTQTSVVCAADSKVTTNGIVGVEQDGNPRWEVQTYDNATKVVRDRNGRIMAMLAGHVAIGSESALDFFSSLSSESHANLESQDRALQALVDRMVGLKCEFWSKTTIAEESWPGLGSKRF